MSSFFKAVLSVIVGFFVAMIVLLPLPVHVRIAFFLAPVFCVYFFLNPFAGFLLFLALRPLIDPLRNIRMQGLSILSITGGFIACFVLFLALTERGFKFFPKTPIRVMYLFFAFAGMTMINSPDKYLAAENLFKILSIIGIYILAYNFVRKPSDASIIVRTLVYSSLIPILAGIFQVLNKAGII